MKISIIIPCLNAAADLPLQLDAIAGQECDWPFEIIVSDNGSNDGTKEVVEKLSETRSNLRWVDASDRRGAAHARNAGVREAASADVILFVDADDVVPPGWLSAMATALEEHEFVACRLNTEELNEPWQQASWQNAQKDGLIQFDPPFLPFAGAGTIGVHRAVHENVGGFDESFLSIEDADYCWRIQLAGTDLWFVSETELYCRFRERMGGIFKQMRRIGECHVLLYRKFLPLGMPRIERPLRTAISRWISLAKSMLKIRTRADLAIAMRLFGWLVGRFLGSVKYRVSCF